MKLRLKEILEQRGITSASFATMVGIHKVSVSYIINGKQMPSVETLERFARALECKVADLLDEGDVVTKPITSDFKCPHCGGSLDIHIQKKELG